MFTFGWLGRILAPEIEDQPDLVETDDAATLKPRVRKDRPRCPFYGFVKVGGIIMDGGEMCNECALTDRYSPCAMQMNGRLPEWDMCCYFNRPENQAELVRSGSARIYPSELKPEGDEPWRGISLDVWYELVMGRVYPQ